MTYLLKRHLLKESNIKNHQIYQINMICFIILQTPQHQNGLDLTVIDCNGSWQDGKKVQPCACARLRFGLPQHDPCLWQARGKPFIVMRCGQRLQRGSWSTLTWHTLSFGSFARICNTGVEWEDMGGEHALPQPKYSVSGATSAHCQNLGG